MIKGASQHLPSKQTKNQNKVMQLVLNILHVQERTHIFSIYFYNRLTQKPKIKLTANAPPMSPAERRYDNVKKWTKNTNIFEKDFVIVPINHEDHWYVVLICYPALLKPRVSKGRLECPVILLLDSLEDGMKDEVVANLREYLACEWRERMVVGQSQGVRLFQQSAMPHFCPDIPQQPNLTDCGLYLLEYVEAFFRSPIQDFSVPIASLASWFTDDQVAFYQLLVRPFYRLLLLPGQGKAGSYCSPDSKTCR